MTKAQASAPGKLYIAGEYAVVDGAAAIVAAVNRFVTVTVDDENLLKKDETAVKNDANLSKNSTFYGSSFYGSIVSEAENYKPLIWSRARNGKSIVIETSATESSATASSATESSVESSATVSPESSIESPESSPSNIEEIIKSYSYVLSAMRVVDAYAIEFGSTFILPSYNLHISSELYDAKSGRKFGLGSSAAVTVAAVRALCEFYKLNLSIQNICKLALIASSLVKKSGSGGDVAASVYGGWIMYRAYDRDWLSAELELVKSGDSSFGKLLCKKWPRLEIKRLDIRSDIKLLVGWTGSPASSAELVSSVKSSAGSGASVISGTSTTRSSAPSLSAPSLSAPQLFTYKDFCAKSEALVQRLIFTLENGDLVGAANGFACARQLLKDLSALTGTVIETPQLTRLIEDALIYDVPAKTSGAGGGDCGIALLYSTDKERIDCVKCAWKENKIRPLNINVAKINGTGSKSENIVLKNADRAVICDSQSWLDDIPEYESDERAKKRPRENMNLLRFGTKFDDIRLPHEGEPATAAASANATAAVSAPSALSAPSASKSTNESPSSTNLITQNRKDAHIALAQEQYHSHANAGFDDIRFVPNALPQLSVESVDTSVSVFDNAAVWSYPLYINAMTGGSEHTRSINASLARVAAKTGVAMASGSLSAALRDSSLASTFSVIREENPNGFVMANVSAGASVSDAMRAVDLLEANALQVHLNAAQELVMPEGDRDLSSWLKNIENIEQIVSAASAVSAAGVPVMVKETGCGLSAKNVEMLLNVGVRYVDISGRGGTNFVSIENARREFGDFGYLADWGFSTVESLLDVLHSSCVCKSSSNQNSLSVFASGGIRNPLDVLRALSLGARAAGVAGEFLHTLMCSGEDALLQQITSWQSQIRTLMALLGCKTVDDVRLHTSLLLSGAAADFAKLRGVNLHDLANR